MEISFANSFSHLRNNDLQQYLLSLPEQLCGSDSFLFACVQHAFNQNNYNYACVEVVFNQQTKVT